MRMRLFTPTDLIPRNLAFYSYSRQLMPNIFKGTAFNCHNLLSVAESKPALSNVFFFLPSITDRKEEINRYKDQVALVPITFTIEDLCKYSPHEDYTFNPAHLESGVEGLNQEDLEWASSLPQSKVEKGKFALGF